MYPCKLNYVCLIHPQLENSRSLHPKNKADSIPKEEWHYWNNDYFRVSRIEYRHQNQSHSIWWSSKAVGSRNFPSHQLRISKAKVQSPFGKKIVGYHHCELQLYKHSKVKFKKFTCYHHFLPSQLFYFFQVGCHSRQRRIQIELYRLLSEVDSGEIAVNAVISKYYFFIQLPYHFADPSIQCNYIL